MEPRLASKEACQRFVALFAAYAPTGDSEALSRLLDAFLRILRRSPRITVSPCETAHPSASIQPLLGLKSRPRLSCCQCICSSMPCLSLSSASDIERTLRSACSANELMKAFRLACDHSPTCPCTEHVRLTLVTAVNPQRKLKAREIVRWMRSSHIG